MALRLLFQDGRYQCCFSYSILLLKIAVFVIYILKWDHT